MPDQERRPKPARLSLTTRLTLLFATASCVVLLLLGWVIGMAIEHHFAQEDVQALRGKLLLAQNIVARVASPADLERLPAEMGDALVGHDDLVVKILGPNREVLLATPDVRFPDDWLALTPNGLSAQVWSAGGHDYRGLAAAIPTRVAGWAPVVVAVAIDTAHHEFFMFNFRRTLWLFVGCAALVTGLLGWIIVRRGLAPLRAMRARAETVTAHRLDQRLPVDAVPAELADLAQTLNEMLGRLEEAFQRLSDFSSDIAHELRTPISNLMMQTQVSLSRARDADTYRDVLESNAEEYERLARMIADMLFLAKADNGLKNDQPLAQCAPVDLAREMRDLFDFYEALADDRGIRLALDGEGWACGDQLMLRRAFSNLLSNALRHTSAGGCVEVGITPAADGDDICLTIDNPGETIAAQHLPHLFDRFYRTDPARQHAGDEGTGLGLAITRAIVAAHRGSIAVSSADGRTRFTVRLPRAADPGRQSAGA